MSENLKERKAFEAWFKEKSPVGGVNAKLAAWDSWRARAAVESDRVSRDVPSVPDVSGLLSEYDMQGSAFAADLLALLSTAGADRVSRDVPADLAAVLLELDTPIAGLLGSHSGKFVPGTSKDSKEFDAFESAIPLVRWTDHERTCRKIAALAASPQPQPVQEPGACAMCGALQDDQIVAQPVQAQPSEMQDTAETLLPHAYLFEKLAMVMPLFQEARDALTAIREDQRIRHGISATLADRMDAAGTFSLDDWMNAQPKPAEQEQKEE